MKVFLFKKLIDKDFIIVMAASIEEARRIGIQKATEVIDKNISEIIEENCEELLRRKIQGQTNWLQSMVSQICFGEFIVLEANQAWFDDANYW